ncbi:uncharacterized protein [Linepithema humile]|uniref:uncharacterized protein isoform X2 n=1 Tax=Linepithema humile TaxID=83485 RepID=UPI00351F39AC
MEEKIKKDRPIFDKENFWIKPDKVEKLNEVRLHSENIRDHPKQAINESQSYLLPTSSNILEEKTYGRDKPDNQGVTENFHKPSQNFTDTWNSQSEWKKPDANSSSQLYSSTDSYFCENYPIREVSQNNIPFEQSDYTLMEIGSVSSQSCVKSSKYEKSNNNSERCVNPTKIQSYENTVKNVAKTKFISEKRLRKNKESSSESTSTKEYSENMQNNSEDSTLDFSDESQYSEQNLNAARSFARLIPFKTIKHSYEAEAKADRNNEEIFEIPAHMLKPGDNVEISPNSGFYLSREKIAYIELKSTTENENCDWKKLVRETLLEVYDESITNYSATGRRGARPAINAVLFKALFKWATEKAERPITRKAYIQCINKCASNKRKYRTKKEKNEKRAPKKVKKIDLR